MYSSFKSSVRKYSPPLVTHLYNLFSRPGDVATSLRIVRDAKLAGTAAERTALIRQVYAISEQIDCRHEQKEILAFVEAILSISGEQAGCVVEAGCFMGGSTAKFSLAAQLANRQLVVFDSFEGLPPVEEQYSRDIHGNELSFTPGKYKGTLDAVKNNVRLFGAIDQCEFVKGWFDDTLPQFNRQIAAVYLDVDLSSSTQTCLKHLYPLLNPGGVLLSQDGHVPQVIAVFDDDVFWETEVGFPKPTVHGLGQQKLLRIIKPNT